MPPKSSFLADLAALGIRPRKGLGQNFLVDPVHRARIVSAAELRRDDAVLEIGPGPGVLTELLVEQAGNVVAVELDARLAAFLRERFAAHPHLSIVQADILKLDVGQLMSHAPAGQVSPAAPGAGRRGYKVVANLPYYITGAVIPHLLEAGPPPDLVVVTVQREVAERMVARPPDMSLLALGVQFYTSPELVGRIPAGAFYPAPNVDSAVVRMRRLTQPAVDVTAEDFFSVARAGFGQRRKQLRNSLAAGLGVAPAQAERWLVAADLAPTRRAETLSIQEWGRLARAVRGEAAG
jgi:16S rRNA (adenine1518-N6/adenine1519-N6)-dimethyltransferase